MLPCFARRFRSRRSPLAVGSVSSSIVLSIDVLGVLISNSQELRNGDSAAVRCVRTQCARQSRDVLRSGFPYWASESAVADVQVPLYYGRRSRIGV
jgi:hypothetical protein